LGNEDLKRSKESKRKCEVVDLFTKHLDFCDISYKSKNGNSIQSTS